MTETEIADGVHYESLFAALNSPDCNLFSCLNYLQQYADNIGVQYYLCRRISKFSMGELRFFIPQFLQLLITVETESIALEEMMKALCKQDVHFSLITFWHLQALLQELSMTPESIGFQTCKRMLNDLQYQLFNLSNSQHTQTSAHSAASGVVHKHHVHREFRENVMPSIALMTSLLAGVTVPKSTQYVEPIVRVQGRQLKSLVFEVVKDVKKSLTENLTKKNTLNNASMGRANYSKDVSSLQRAKSMTSTRARKSTGSLPQASSPLQHTVSKARKSEELNFDMIDTYVDLNMPSLSRPSLKPKSKSSISVGRPKGDVYSSPTSPQQSHANDTIGNLVSSMPNLHVSTSIEKDSADSLNYMSDGSYASSIRNSFDYRDSSEMESLYGDDDSFSIAEKKMVSRVPLSPSQQVKLLKSSYFKQETQFVIALQNISIRLSKVPKEARLSTLKAELSMLNHDLPCEVDIPLLLPKNKRGKLHKICRICVNESAVLNSAERVPYLLLIEYLADDIDFDPQSQGNKSVFSKLENKENTDTFKLTDKNYRFDLAGKPISSSTNLERLAIDPMSPKSSHSRVSSALSSSISANDIDDMDLGDVSVVKLSNKLEHKRVTSKVSTNDRPRTPTVIEPTENKQLENDDSELAEQLRIAAIMLTQLESSTSTLPAAQATQIKTKLIESMQVMQNGFGVRHMQELEGSAGERKLSNDLKVAGISYLGEDWNAKKKRIRMESQFGHLENWELCSVIAKTGDDLTQEAFACQLIQTMARIWYKDNIRVWIKRMRILVTSSNTGLVETITDALSVHSIKKSLTQHMIRNNENPKGQIATLKDHFLRTFGAENTPRYKLAQENFCISLAASSVICYILQIKDRHNGNVMLDADGHVIHIDFGFLLSNSPGSVGFEAAPFKFTNEYLEILGGVDSYYFKMFKDLMKEAFKSIRRNAGPLISMIELMQKDSQLPCFKAGENTSVLMKQRLQLHLTDEEVDLFIENVLINKSVGSMYTRLYDQFQLITQGIYI